MMRRNLPFLMQKIAAIIKLTFRPLFLLLLFVGSMLYTNAQTPIFFSTNGSGAGGTWTAAKLGSTANIQAAIAAGNKIYLKAGTYNISASLLAGASSVYIKGGYPTSATNRDTSNYNPNINITTFDGGSSIQILGTYTSAALTLTAYGIVFQNGKSGTGGGVLDFYGIGGGRAVLSFVDCSFTSNTNTSTGAHYGGAISMWGYVLVTNQAVSFNNCLFYSNTMPGSGSLGGGGALGFNNIYGTVNINKTSFTSNNVSQNAGGGAIFINNAGSSTANATFNITNSNFCSNSATVSTSGTGAGGAINFTNSAVYNTALNISSTNFVNNLAYAQGGAVYLTGGQGLATSTWNNVIFYGNQKAYNHAGSPYPASTNDVYDGQSVIASFSYSPLTINNTGFQTAANSTNYPYVTLGSGNYLNSTNPLPSCPTSINTAAVALSGTVWNDANNSKTIDGTEAGTNTGNTLYVNLVDVTTGTVYGSVSVASDGTYSGLTAPLGGDTYKLVLSTSNTSTSAGPLPASWSNTGQNVGSNTATQSGTLGQIELPTTFSSGTLSAQNFGIRSLLNISGTVWDDADGDATIDGTEVGTNTGNTLYVNLVNTTTNTVSQSVAVASNGTYSGLSAYLGGNTYKLILSTSSTSTGAGPLPTGWVNTGENIGSNTATQSGTLGQIELPSSFSSSTLSAQNFGIERLPTANPLTRGTQTNPGGTATIAVGTLTGYDAEDGYYSGSSGTNTIKIATLPTNGTLYYNGSPVSAGDVISNYTPSLLKIDPNDGNITTSFTFSEVDAAGQASTPATVTIPFSSGSCGGTVTYVPTAASFSGSAAAGGTYTVTYTRGNDQSINPIIYGYSWPANFTMTFNISKLDPTDALSASSISYASVGTTTTTSTTAGLTAIQAPVTVGSSAASTLTLVKNTAYTASALTNAGYPANLTALYNTNIFGVIPNTLTTPAYTAPTSSTTGNFLTTSQYNVTAGNRPSIAAPFSYTATYSWGILPNGNFSIVASNNVTQFGNSIAYNWDKTLSLNGGYGVEGGSVSAQQVMGATSPSSTTMPVGSFIAYNVVFNNIVVCFSTVSISGTIYNDANGLTDNTVNGTGTNAGGTLYVALYDNTTGKVVAYSAVASNGTYTVSGAINDAYTTYLTSTLPTVGQTAVPTVTLPSGWKNTGENLGSGNGSDGVPNGILSIGTVSAATGNANFGIVQCPNGLSITASASQAVVCSSQTTAINLTSTPSGGITPYASYAWSGSGLVASNTQNTTAKPTGTGTYSVTVTDALGCTATGTTPTVTYDNPTPSIVTQCNGTAIRLADANSVAATSYTWTTTSNGRFYTSAAYDLSTDSNVSHLPGPYIITKGSYTLVVTDANGCTGTDAKNLTGTICGTVLASNMQGVTAQRHGSTVQVQWAVTNESTVKNYVIERSADGNTFTTAGTLNALNTGNHTYSFNDDVSLIGCIKLYYRVKQTNADGVIYYSNIIPVNCNANDVDEYVLKVYPNPVQTGSRLTVSYSLPATVTKAQLVITNILGAAGKNIIINNNGAIATQTIDIQNMSAGVYLVRILSDKWVSKTIKIIKAN